MFGMGRPLAGPPIEPCERDCGYFKLFRAVRAFGEKFGFEDREKFGNAPARCDGLERMSSEGAMSKLDLIKMWYRISFQPMRPLFSWAVPSVEALDVIANAVSTHRQAGLVEIGSGPGYWAYMLKHRYGVDTVCFDTDAASFLLSYGQDIEYQMHPFVDVFRGGPEVLHGGSYADHILFLCYPPPANRMARDALLNYNGNYVVYVGALDIAHVVGPDVKLCHRPKIMNGVGTGDRGFFFELCKSWDVVTIVRLPSHFFCDDHLVLLTKKNHRAISSPHPRPHMDMKACWAKEPNAEQLVHNQAAEAWTLFQKEFAKYAKTHALEYSPDLDNPLAAPALGGGTHEPGDAEGSKGPGEKHSLEYSPDLDNPLAAPTLGGGTDGSPRRDVEGSKGPSQGLPPDALIVDPSKDWRDNLSTLIQQHPDLTSADFLEVMAAHFPGLTRTQLKHARKRILDARKR